jgi:hypothetical protein
MPFARRTDPKTSHDAAESVQNITATQQAILEICHKPITDHTLVAYYKNLADQGIVPRASESGIRSRRAELVAKGLVVDSGKRAPTYSGRSQIIWQAHDYRGPQ